MGETRQNKDEQLNTSEGLAKMKMWKTFSNSLGILKYNAFVAIYIK